MVHWTCNRLNPERAFENPADVWPFKNGLLSNQRPVFVPRDALFLLVPKPRGWGRYNGPAEPDKFDKNDRSETLLF